MLEGLSYLIMYKYVRYKQCNAIVAVWKINFETLHKQLWSANYVTYLKINKSLIPVNKNVGISVYNGDENLSIIFKIWWKRSLSSHIIAKSESFVRNNKQQAWKRAAEAEIVYMLKCRHRVNDFTSVSSLGLLPG